MSIIPVTEGKQTILGIYGWKKNFGINFVFR